MSCALHERDQRPASGSGFIRSVRPRPRLILAPTQVLAQGRRKPRITR